MKEEKLEDILKVPVRVSAKQASILAEALKKEAALQSSMSSYNQYISSTGLNTTDVSRTAITTISTTSGTGTTTYRMGSIGGWVVSEQPSMHSRIINYAFIVNEVVLDTKDKNKQGIVEEIIYSHKTNTNKYLVKFSDAEIKWMNEDELTKLGDIKKQVTEENYPF